MLADSAFSNVADPVRFRQDLMNIAKTTLSSKILTGDKEHFANLAVDAILRLKGACREAGCGEGFFLNVKSDEATGDWARRFGGEVFRGVELPRG